MSTQPFKSICTNIRRLSDPAALSNLFKPFPHPSSFAPSRRESPFPRQFSLAFNPNAPSFESEARFVPFRGANIVEPSSCLLRAINCRVHASIVDRCLNIQLALPNPPSQQQQQLVNSHYFQHLLSSPLALSPPVNHPRAPLGPLCSSHTLLHSTSALPLPPSHLSNQRIY